MATGNLVFCRVASLTCCSFIAEHAEPMRCFLPLCKVSYCPTLHREYLETTGHGYVLHKPWSWLCHTCSILQSRHMLTWEVNSQVIHRLCCFLLQAKPVRLQHSIARCCTMHGGFNPPWLKTLSEDYDNQTRVCQKHGFSSPKFMFHCRWVHLTRNAWRLETKGIKMPLTLSSSLRCSIFLIIGSSQNVFTLFPGVSAFEWALTLAEKQSCIHQGS